jgi:glucose-1-phosphate cytidylyltransferase
MKAVILAGGQGTRLSPFTNDLIPKPMMPIGDSPMLEHIIRIYTAFGVEDIIIAAGRQDYIIRGWVESVGVKALKARSVEVVQTGDTSGTAGRLLPLQERLYDNTFFLTYGDGVADIDIAALLSYHDRCVIEHNALVTLAAVHPPARFGNLRLEGDLATLFMEKMQADEGRVNGGFYVVQPEVVDRCTNYNMRWEYEILPRIAQMRRLAAYRHDGFWFCVDHPREREQLEEIALAGDPPWLRFWRERCEKKS